ncbi:MAG: hypothetical protein ACXVC6_11050 [Bacteroidia bacterium]
MNKKYITISLLLLSLLFCFCRKSLLKRITFSGRVVNYLTKAPAVLNLSVIAMTGHSNQISVDLGKTQTDFNGNFFIKCNAVQNNHYYILDDYGMPGIAYANGSKDFGTIEGGFCTFFLRVTLVPISTSDIEFPTAGPNKTMLHFNAGTSTSFVTSLNSISKFEFNNGIFKKFALRWRTFPGGVQVDSARTLPITSLDTLRMTINY